MMTTTMFIILFTIFCLCLSFSVGDQGDNNNRLSLLRKGRILQEQDDTNTRRLRRKFIEKSYRCASSSVEANNMSGKQCQDVTKYCISAHSGSLLDCGIGQRCMQTPNCPFAKLFILTKPASHPAYRCIKSDNEIENTNTNSGMCDQLIDCYNETTKSKDDQLCTSISGTKCLLTPNCTSDKNN